MNTATGSTGASSILENSAKDLVSGLTKNIPTIPYWREALLIGGVAILVIFLIWYWANFLR